MSELDKLATASPLCRGLRDNPVPVHGACATKKRGKVLGTGEPVEVDWLISVFPHDIEINTDDTFASDSQSKRREEKVARVTFILSAFFRLARPHCKRQ